MPIQQWLFGSRTPVITLSPLQRQDWLWAVLCSGLYLGYFLLFQPLITVFDGQGWDGRDYFRLAQGDYETPVYPLVQRIGMPILAAQGPSADLLTNFLAWNTLFAFLHGVVTWILIARLETRRLPWLRLATWMMVCAFQTAPIPGAVWMPVQNDIAAALLSQLLLLVVLTGNCQGWLLITLFFLGTLCRENFAQYAIFFLFRWNLLWNHRLGLPGNLLHILRVNAREASLLLLPAITGYLAAMTIINSLVSKGMTVAERYRFYVDGVQWHHFSDVLLALIGILSPVFFLFLSHRLGGLKAVEPVLPPIPVAIILGIFLVISLGAGLNTERYLYWMMPFLALQAMPVIVSLYENGRRASLRFCALYAIYMQRAVLPIEPSGDGGCGPVDILFANSTFLGHFAQQCADLPLPLLEFFFGFALPVAILLAVWSPLQDTKAMHRI